MDELSKLQLKIDKLEKENSTLRKMVDYLLPKKPWTKTGAIVISYRRETLDKFEKTYMEL